MVWLVLLLMDQKVKYWKNETISITHNMLMLLKIKRITWGIYR
jgi:hypothetical protein